MADVPDIAGIFDGVQTRLATITGLRAYSEEPDAIHTPAAFPDPTSIAIAYDLDMGGSIALSFKVHLALQGGPKGFARAQQALLPYLATSGTSSIKAAIEGDQTLGGKVQTLRVSSAQDIGLYERAGSTYYGADWTVTVWP